MRRRDRNKAGMPLTKRQSDVIGLIAQGLSAKEIGRALSISHRTVEMLTQELKWRLGARSKAHAVILCRTT